jgi:hypothetical protein
MTRPTFRRIVGIAIRWLLFSSVVTGLLAIAPLIMNGFGQGFWADLMHLGLLGVIGGFCGAGLVALVAMAKSMRGLHLASGQMRPTEAVMKETIAAHYRTVWLLPMRITVAGRLYLTTSQLVFKAHALQPGPAEIVIPLTEITHVRPCRHSVFQLQNGLLIEKVEGQQELFACNLEYQTEEWVSAIMVLRGMGPAIEGCMDHGDTNLPMPKTLASTDIKTEGPGEFAERPPG